MRGKMLTTGAIDEVFIVLFFQFVSIGEHFLNINLCGGEVSTFVEIIGEKHKWDLRGMANTCVDLVWLLIQASPP